MTEIETWYEEATRVLNFHEEKQKKHGSSRSGRPDTLSGHQGWGVRETCEVLNLSVRRVIEDLRIGRILEIRPELKDESRQAALTALGKIPKDREIDILISVVRTAIVKLKIKNNPVATELEVAITNFERGINAFRSGEPSRLDAGLRRPGKSS